MNKSLAGKMALITGCGRGLGQALAMTLGQAGVKIVAADIRGDAAAAVAEQLRREGGTAAAEELDVGDARQAERAVAATLERFGRLDILINNAGTDVTAAFERLAVKEWQRVLRTNLHGPFLLSKFAFPVMKAQGSGHIINICSTAAKRAWPNATAYHASKWGLLGFSHALHTEGRPHGVKVTAVIAGGMATPFLLDRFPELDPAALQNPLNVARTIQFVLTRPDETVVPEITVVPMRETSWP